MDFKEIDEIVAVLRDSPLAELEVRRGNQSLRLRRAVERKAPAPPKPAPSPATAAVASSARPTPGGGQPDDSLPGATPVTASLVGIFHTLSPPVAEGTVVAERQALGQIESMRIMNDCLAPRAGRIVRTRVEDGQPVMYGQVLFEIADPEIAEESAP